MDGDDRRHHQYGQPPTYQVPSSTPANPTLHMPPPAHATERYAQAAVRTDASRSSLSRPQATGFGAYGYAEQQYPASALQGGAMQGVEMQFSPGYVQDSSRPHAGTMQQQVPQQQYTTYGQSVMMQAPPPSHAYDSLPHYQQRQSAAIEVLADRFGEPSYLPSNVQGGMTPAQYLTSQPEQVAFQQQLHQARPDPAQRHPQHAGPIPMSDHQYSDDTQAKVLAADTLEDEKRQYQHQLALTFEAIRAGKVNEASEKLMQVSRWLLSSVVALGEFSQLPKTNVRWSNKFQDFILMTLKNMTLDSNYGETLISVGKL